MIDIEMKLVAPLGEGRVQLECMCGHQFTFAPVDRINAIGRGKKTKARCPKCKTTWNGQIDDLAQAYTMTPKHYALYVRVDNPEMNKHLGIDDQPEGCVRAGVGLGADISHFALGAIARFCEKNEPIIMIVKRISKAEYEEAKQVEIDRLRASMMIGSVGMLGLLLNEGQEEEGE